MALMLVRYPEEDGGYFTGAAALWAARHNATLMQSDRVSGNIPESVKEFPSEDGYLAHAGWLWVDRLHAGTPSWPASDEAILARAATMASVVVPFLSRDLPWAITLQQRAMSAGTDCTIVTSHTQSDSLFLKTGDGAKCLVGHRDSLGRLFPIGSSPPTTKQEKPKRLKIAVTGDEKHHRHRNLATLCALGDAADRLGLDLDLAFLSDHDVSRHGTSACLDGVAGVVLPGGDVANASTQIVVADHCRHAGIPIVGLCLGMQSMLTALIRTHQSYADADLAERAPQARSHSFVPILDRAGAIRRRVGAQSLATNARSAFGRALESAPVIRSNHRYRLNPALLPLLAQMGVEIAAMDRSGGIVEAIALPAHRHFTGMQGHPECVSTPARPHPALLNFMHSSTAYAEAEKVMI